MIKTKEILEKYPINCRIIDCYGVKNRRIMNSLISISPNKPLGTIVLGHHHIYDPIKNIWAVVEKDYTPQSRTRFRESRGLAAVGAHQKPT